MDEIINKLNIKLLKNYEKNQIDEITAYLQIILYDYDITRRETAVTVYEGDYDEQIVRKFLATKMVQGCSQKTILMYQNALHSFRKKIQKPIVDITADDILYFFAMRNTVDNVSAITQDNELRVLRTFYNFLATEDIVPKNPTLKIKKIKGKKKVKKAFTEEELERMRNACNNRMGLNRKHLALIELLISTGCRASEISNIQLCDIEGDKIKILGKGNKERWVYVNARAKIALENYLKVRSTSSPYLFTGINVITREETEKFSGEAVNQIVKKVAKRAGIDDAHAHKFRRTAATLALRRGMPIELVSKMLGHEQLATTQIYLELTDDDLANAHRKYC